MSVVGGRPILQIDRTVSIVAAASVVCTIVGAVWYEGAYRARAETRLAAVEQQAAISISDHDVLIAIAKDVEWIRRALERLDADRRSR
jgi:hypothetical protein